MHTTARGEGKGYRGQRVAMAGGGHTASAAMGRRMGRTRQGQRGAVALLWCGRTHGRSGWQQAWGDMDKQQRATKAASAGWKRDVGEG